MRQSSPRRPLRILACACGTVAALASWAAPARGVDYSWINPVGGFFGQPTFWTPFDPVPPPPIYLGPGGAIDTVNFNLGFAPENRYTVTGVSGENDQLHIHNDSLTLEISEYELLSGELDSDSGIGSFIAGVDAGDNANVILTGTGPAVFQTKFGIIGNADGSTGVVTVENLTWNHAGNFFVGYLGTGTLTIENGGAVTTEVGGFLVGYMAGSTGAVVVRGDDASWTIHGVTIGREGTGSLTIEDGGSVVSTDSGVGFFEDSSGTATIRGAGSSWSTRLATISYQGEAELTIEDGGSAFSARAWIGGWKNESFHPVDASVQVVGVGSRWTVEETDACAFFCDGTMIVGVANRATMTIGDGGRVSNTDSWIGYQAESIGGVLVSGAGSMWTNDGELFVGEGGTGTLTIAGGGSVSNKTGWIAANAGSIGSVIVRGVRSRWTNEGELFVGSFGAGTLTIDDGAEVSNDGVWIGTSPGSTGAATVRGADATWTSNGQFIVGYRAEGTMAIQAGGTVANDGDSLIGFTPLAGAVVTVSGPRSTWTNTGGLVVANSGTGTLLVEAGATVSNTSGIVGNDVSANGTVTVTGNNSLWANGGTLIVGNSGVGTLNVQQRGVVSAVGGLAVGLLGRVEGDGTIIADVTNSGVVAPGNSPGNLEVEGFKQTSSGTLEIELANINLGNFDVLTVQGKAMLAGTLDVSFIDGFMPASGDRFEIITAASVLDVFDTVNLPALPGDLLWFVNYSATSVELVSTYGADFDEDGDVDDDDLTSWQGGFGSGLATHMTGDANTDVAANGFDFLTWQRQYTGPNSLAAASLAVPEPSTWALLSLSAMGVKLARRRRIAE